MHGRIQSFTKRQVRERERLFSPEDTSWPADDDYGANWDWLIFILCAFGMAAALGCLAILFFLSSILIQWP